MEDNPNLKGVVALYRSVYSAQRKLSRRIPDQLPHIEGAQVSMRVDQGRLLLEPGEVEVDLQVLEDMMRELGRVLERRGDTASSGMEGFLEKELEDSGRLRRMADAFVARREEELAELMDGYSLDNALLYLLLHISLAPFYWSQANALARRADLDQVPQGTCPICGDLPVMGFLRSEDGLRVLECSLCGSRWGIPRMMCPFCLTMDQEKIKYIFAEEKPHNRAYLCDNCGRYVKISTLRGDSSEEIVMPLEDLATAHMDQAARERGYLRGCRTVFS